MAAKSGKKFRSLMDISPAMVWITDVDGKCTYVSKECLRFTGHIPEGPDGFIWMDRVHPDDAAEMKLSFDKHAQEHTPFFRDYRLLHHTGEYRWVADSGHPHFEENGEYVGYVGMIVDIHDRKMLELKLKEQRLEMYNIFMQTPAAVALVRGPNFVYEMANPAYRELTHHRKLLGLTIRESAPDAPEEIFKILDNVYHKGETFSAEDYPIKFDWKRDGKPYLRYMTFTYEPIKDVQGKTEAVLVFAYETTNQVIARNELETLAKKTQIASIAKSQFLANMSHEIRTPLGAMLGFTELLKNEDVDKTQRAQYIDIISRNGQTLTKIIDDILDLSKIEAGRMQFEILPVSVEAIIDDILDLFQEKARAKNIELSKSIPAEFPQIYSDATKLRQILVNIVGNAIKFTDAGKVHIVANIRHKAQDACEVMISVKDTGPGLSEEQIEKLFQPFTQVDYSSTRKFGGTGLGLALSRQLANALHGDLHIAWSEVGKGSTFELTIESRIVRDDYSTNFEFVNKTKDLEQLDMKVLLVEDSLDNQMFIQHILTQHGVKVDTANDGIQGVQRALNGNYDVVLMDIQMPNMDGYQAIAQLKSANYKTPVYALTAHALDEERFKTKAAGYTGHLTKPVNIRELLETLAQHLRN